MADPLGLGNATVGDATSRTARFVDNGGWLPHELSRGQPGSPVPVPPKPALHAVAPVTTHEVQAAVEGVGEVVQRQTVMFLGEQFAIADRIGLMPLMKFAHAANKGLDSNDLRGMAALYEMVRDCIVDPDSEASLQEWDRFERHAVDRKAEADDLMDVVNRVVELVAARPRQPPGSSSAGRLTTSDGSKGSSSSPATHRAAPAEVDGLVAVNALLDRSTG